MPLLRLLLLAARQPPAVQVTGDVLEPLTLNVTEVEKLPAATGDPSGPFRLIDCTASRAARSVRRLTTLHIAYLKK